MAAGNQPATKNWPRKVRALVTTPGGGGISAQLEQNDMGGVGGVTFTFSVPPVTTGTYLITANANVFTAGHYKIFLPAFALPNTEFVLGPVSATSVIFYTYVGNVLTNGLLSNEPLIIEFY